MDKQTLVGMLREYGVMTRRLREAMQCLSEEERLVVERLDIVPKNGNLGELCQELGVEKSAVYRRRDKALARLGRALEAGSRWDDFSRGMR